jgi:hypothetical protein
MTSSIQLSHAEFARVLKRAGYPLEVIEEVAAQLADQSMSIATRTSSTATT